MSYIHNPDYHRKILLSDILCPKKIINSELGELFIKLDILEEKYDKLRQNRPLYSSSNKNYDIWATDIQELRIKIAKTAIEINKIDIVINKKWYEYWEIYPEYIDY